MGSVISGYEYDIFISYRQKDNKGKRWVSEFAESLKTELESTFKEDLSVYFDLNPYDGLLETDDVNASLKDKLKCLVFIPVISQTYCDSESFAWKNEFCAFNRLAKEDQFGRDIKLANGNVASRILPVKIHELDPDDIKLLEDEIGGPVRSIDFIYKSKGVNRPLSAYEDHPQDNLNKIYYRDQINKVANSIKSILSALKTYNEGTIPRNGKVQTRQVKIKAPGIKIVIGSMSLLCLAALLYFFIPRNSGSYIQEEKTIAVIPFRNLSNDTAQSYFCDGFTEEILNNLQKINSFTVRSRLSADQYRNSQKSITTIGNELRVNYIITGSVGKESDYLKIWIQLIDAKADRPIWSNDYTREMKQLFSLQSEIAKEVAHELQAVLTPEEIEDIEKKATESLEAHNYYLQGNYYFRKNYSAKDNKTAIELYEKAVKVDPRYALAYTGIANCLLDQYFNYQNHREEILQKSKEAIDKAFEIDPDLPDAHLALGNYYYQGKMDFSRALEQFEIVLKDQPKNTIATYWSAAVHRREGKWDMAKTRFEKAFELDPGRSEISEDVGETFDLLRDYPKAENYYTTSIIIRPDWIIPYYFLSQMYLRWNGDIEKAKKILADAVHNNKDFVTDSLFIEASVLIDIYGGDYASALEQISLLRCDVIHSQFWYKPKYLYLAAVYGLMKNTEYKLAYYDSARVFLESRMNAMPDDPRLLSSLGIAYAGLGLNNKAKETSERAVELLPVSQEAYKGTFLVENLAVVYTMTGNYEKAISEIKYLLSIPGFLSPKMLEMDPVWEPLRDHPGFIKLLETHKANNN